MKLGHQRGHGAAGRGSNADIDKYRHSIISKVEELYAAAVRGGDGGHGGERGELPGLQGADGQGDGEARDPRHLRGEQPARRARPHGQGGGQGQGGAGDCGQEPGRGQEDGGSTR